MAGSGRKNGIIKIITYVLLVNFINLTANFYQESSLDHTLLKHNDPYDSVTELVLEYIMDMDEETVPDTEVPEDKRKMLDIKTLIGFETFQLSRQDLASVISEQYVFTNWYQNIALERISPPPKFLIG
jgi:hypothetical protein